jgi:2-polyprenyl-3-methyl-5-hydroxy-6-metoxy-1,4-benzoquinol methylase
MKKLTPSSDWPESWKLSFHHDQMEIYGDSLRSGYAYAYRGRRAATLDLIKKVARPGARILDVAAAQGNMTLALAELGYEVTWNDLRHELSDYVKQKHERGIIHFAPGDIFKLRFEQPFDAVVMTEVIEHVAHPDEFLRKIAEFVRPGGHIVMTTPNGEYFRNTLPKFSECPNPSEYESLQFKPDADGHIFLLHRSEVEQMARAAGIEILEFRLLNNPLTSGHVKLGRVIPFLPTRSVQSVERLTDMLPMPLKRKLLTSLAVLFRTAT